jgi:hypothetical protein
LLAATSRLDNIFEPTWTPTAADLYPLADFDLDFVRAWMLSFNFRQWRSDVKPGLLRRWLKADAAILPQHPSSNAAGYYDQAASTINKVKAWGWGLSGWF